MNYGLTKREAEVYEIFGKYNYSISEGAKALLMAPTTAKTHLSRIYLKLGLRSRLDLVRHYLTHQV